MWDWYNRPGGHAALPLRTVVVVMIVAGLLVGVLFVILYTLLAPLLFTRVPG
jgi:hypothetical protein